MSMVLMLQIFRRNTFEFISCRLSHISIHLNLIIDKKKELWDVIDMKSPIGSFHCICNWTIRLYAIFVVELHVKSNNVQDGVCSVLSIFIWFLKKMILIFFLNLFLLKNCRFFSDFWVWTWVYFIKNQIWTKQSFWTFNT